MRMLVAAATAMEIDKLVSKLGAATTRTPRLNAYTCAGHQIDVLVTGIGMVATAAWCARTLGEAGYGLALNFGVCGAFDRTLPLAEVVHVTSDRIAELGVEDGDRFVTMQELGLPGQDEHPLSGGELVNAAPPRNAALTALPAVRGITVNTAHGNTRTIAEATARFKPDVESMEGAAFMYACLIHGLPFAQVRAVSNIVEPRNRGAWQLTEAIESLARTGLSIIERA